MAEADRPLLGFKVLDLADEPGVFATRLLADLGADVVRIEPAEGDRLRHRGPHIAGSDSIEGSLAHLLYNAGKRSLAVGTPEVPSLDHADALLEWADVAVAPLRKSAEMVRFLDPDRLAKHHPRLGVVDLVFRRGVPEAPGSDLAAVAAGGLLWLSGFADDPPNYPAGKLAYKQVSLAAAFSAVALRRDRSHGGMTRRVTVSMQEAVAWTTLQSGNQNAWIWTHSSPARPGGLAGGGRSVFRSRDGKWVSFVTPPPYWASYAEWVREVLLDETFLSEEWRDPRYRVRGISQIAASTEALCAKLTRDVLVDFGQRRHLLICPVNTMADLAADGHLRARGFFVETRQHFLSRPVILPASPFRIADHPIPPGAAPRLGEHTQEVLAEAQEAPAASLVAALERPVGHHQPLRGVRVLDFCWLIAGPLSTRLLADLGAEVIKVESMARLDRIREGTLAPPTGQTVNTAPVFNDCNANKKSINLNLGTPRGIHIAKRLAACSDIVTSNFTPDRMDRWGLGYDDLRAIKPDLIVASMPVMGRHGPHNFWGAYGNGVIAMSGISSLTGFAERPPIGLGTLHSDFTAPYFLGLQIMAALDQRDRTGRGQFIEMAQYETAVSLLDTELVDHLNSGVVPTRAGNRSSQESPHGVFPARGDDCWVALSVRDDEEWQALCRVMQRPDLRIRDDLATTALRREHEDEIESATSAWTGSLPADDVVNQLAACGLAASRVERVEDLIKGDLMRDGYFVSVAHPECGSMLTQQEPVTWDGERLPTQRAPLFGEHTHGVLTDLLGIEDPEFAQLVADGVLS